MAKQKTLVQDSHTRSKILEQNAKVAYESVPSQLEMLNGHITASQEFMARHDGDAELTHEIDEMLHEAARQGNIGGG